ncbi:MAG: transcription termination factor NusA [Acidobacteria bacterium]|nr:transcription termination factor NusA [Acidobacteriota bacterium]
MAASLLHQMIDQISKEKNIDPKVIIGALEDAMVAAAKKYFRTNEDLQSRYEPDTGMIEVFAVKRVVDEVTNDSREISLEEAKEIDESLEIDDTVEVPKPTDVLGRIAAQTAKQVIFQKVREAERENVYSEYNERVGELINGIVRRFEGSDIIVDIGKTEAVLPYHEQSRSESYKQGDRMRAVIVRVSKLSKGPQVILSRTDPALLMRLFEMEIPEVYDGTVTIKHAVREAGERAKVAVRSRDTDVDPVGACVGMKGSRINSVIRELRGEKIDIIEYSDDLIEYALNALSPARISKVLIADAEQKILEVVVQEDQLSLAIGKKGQNVRLASKLLGWQIEIKSEEEKRREVATEMEKMAAGLTDVSQLALGEKTAEKLYQAGVTTVRELVNLNEEELREIPGIGEKTAARVLVTARQFLEGAERRRLQRAEGEEAEEESVEEEATEEETPEEEATEEEATEEEATEEAATGEAAASEAKPSAAEEREPAEKSERETRTSPGQEPVIREPSEALSEGTEVGHNIPGGTVSEDKGE